MSTGARNSNRSAFTANQWQELEHQALIFKYMVSGVPVPPQLLYSLHPPNHLQQQQPIGWGCYQVGFGRKADPEPGRCRRTDGKKWRCAKEAHPDSKYCEKHMHRGRNRSRKPVELASPVTNSSAAAPPPPPPAASLTLNTDNHLLSFPASTSSPMSLMPSSSSSSSSSSSQPINYTHQNPHNYQPCHSNPFMLLDSPRTGINQDYRVYHGARDVVGVNKRALFAEASSMATIADVNGGSYDQSIGNMYTKQGQPVQEQCFVLGADIKSFRPMRSENDQDHETPKPAVHHQFLEDWDSPEDHQLDHSTNWLDLASNARANK